jgi:hypothetical protein
MAGSLKDAAGYRPAAFLPAPSLAPEQLVLGRYTFLPYARSGVAAGLTTPFSTEAGVRATIEVVVPVHAEGPPLEAKIPVTVRGPGDVLALDPRQIIRRYPEPGTGDADATDLVHVELDTPDLPWQFTPTGPDAQGRLRPWLRLVVVRQAEVRVTPPTGRGLETITMPASELGPVDDAWAWAHVQVLGAVGGAPALAERLDRGNPQVNLARILSPRRLNDDTAYRACLVPTFAAGREAGLGTLVTTDKLRYSWADGDPEVTLPVYDSWTFSTGRKGDFEELAWRLDPVPAPAEVGRRVLDASRPGGKVPDTTQPARLELHGPLVSVNAPDAPDGFPLATGEFDRRDELAAALNAPDDYRHRPGVQDDDPPRSRRRSKRARTSGSPAPAPARRAGSTSSTWTPATASSPVSADGWCSASRRR